MKYKLIKAKDEDFKFIEDAKITTIFDYAKNISAEEREDILAYVNRFTKKFLKDYKIIVSENQKCGVLLIREHEDGFLLDEIYLLPEFRNLGIGSALISEALNKYNKLYLWVYKDNINAVKLYKKLGFNVVEDVNERYFMLHEKIITNAKDE